jgi:predicted metalloprotease
MGASRVALVALVALIAAGPATGAAKPPPLKRMPVAQKAKLVTPTLACPAGPKSCLTYHDFVVTIGADVERFWANEALKAGVPWQPAEQREIPLGTTDSSTCNGGEAVTSETGPFYCSIDGAGTVFLPLDSIKSIIFPDTSSYLPDAFAVSYVIAHEWAHHVQHQLGLLSGRPSILIELQADCLAGVWGYTAWSRKLVTQADIGRTLRVAALVGDAPGTPADAPGAHGSASQRVQAYLVGFNSGSPTACAAQ